MNKLNSKRGRKPLGFHSVHLEIDYETYQKLKELKKKSGISVNEHIRKAINNYLENEDQIIYFPAITQY